MSVTRLSRDELFDPDDAEYWLNEPDPDRCPRCDGSGEVTTCDYESYFGAMMKPCPQCHGTLDGIGHGRLS